MILRTHSNTLPVCSQRTINRNHLVTHGWKTYTLPNPLECLKPPASNSFGLFLVARYQASSPLLRLLHDTNVTTVVHRRRCEIKKNAMLTSTTSPPLDQLRSLRSLGDTAGFWISILICLLCESQVILHKPPLVKESSAASKNFQGQNKISYSRKVSLCLFVLLNNKRFDGRYLRG
jgi:hypothetical protein